MKPRPVVVLLATFWCPDHPAIGVFMFTFAVDNIIELVISGQLFLYKGADNFLVTMGKNKPRESVLAPANGADVVHVKLG